MCRGDWNLSKNLERRKEVLDGERAVNETYIQELEARFGKANRPIAVARSAIWTDDIPTNRPGGAAIGPLIGRVALLATDAILGDDFYIGPSREDRGGVEVVSWSAPVAGLFFDGRQAQEAGDFDPGHVGARRSFRSKNRDLVDYEDDLEAGVSEDDVFVLTTRTLDVPTAPKITRPKPKPTQRKPQPATTNDNQQQPPKGDKATSEPSSAQTHEDLESFGGLRAGRLVLEAISRPRTTELGSVLSTLQPDQYRLVTWPHSEPLIVQGQPGSGKTIVATHRAGYLTHPDRDQDRLSRVAVIGPSPQWKDHITKSIADVGGQGVSVFCLSDLMKELSFGLDHELHLDDEHYLDTDWRLGRVARLATLRLQASGQLSRSDLQQNPQRRAQLVVDQLIRHAALLNQPGESTDFGQQPEQRSDLDRQLSDDPELSGWLLQAKNWNSARSRAKYLPFLAAVGLEVRRLTPAQRFEHLIVDEAQDVRPLEWRILSKLLDDGGTWSLFGDLHQRRSDYSPTWAKLEKYLEIPISEEILSTGFRSTNEILRYASRLLPKDARNISGLRSGPPVDPIRTTARNLINVAVENANELLAAYPQGTVGVIAMEAEVEAVISDLMAEGWRRTAERSVYTRDGRKIGIYRPVQARGLEFDGVVVVEPSEFPENLGRRGRLFTSLTRANQELRIVHSQGMPQELK